MVSTARQSSATLTAALGPAARRLGKEIDRFQFDRALELLHRIRDERASGAPDKDA